jgi:hypothetical protein
MAKLSIYYNNDCSELVMSREIDIINKYAPSIIKNKFWKVQNDSSVNQSRSTDFEMIEYGEYILSVVEKYKEVDPDFNLFQLFFIQKPEDFNIKLYLMSIYNKNYSFLNTFISSYVINLTNNSYDPLLHKDFLKYLVLVQIDLSHHLDNPLCFNSEINHKMYKKDLDELKSFGYFNLKFGEAGYVGVWE